MRRLAPLIACWGLATAFLAAPASGHASCDKASPADGQTLTSAPSEVYCDFTEPPAPGSSSMEITDSCGRRVDDGEVTIVGLRMGVGMTATEPSEYLVRWVTLSLQDGHKAFGEWLFRVAGTAAPCPGASGPPSPEPSTSDAPTSSPTTEPTRGSGEPVPPGSAKPGPSPTRPAPTTGAKKAGSAIGGPLTPAGAAREDPGGALVAIVAVALILALAGGFAARAAASEEGS